MYQINDYVVYGSTGVCQVTDISRENFGGSTDREYYVLNPVYGNSMEIFIPTDKPNDAMRRMLSKDEIIELIRFMPEIDSEWIDDDKFRKATFSGILQAGDQQKIIQLIKSIYERNVELEKNGKRLPSSDIEAMKQAEKQLYNEFALVLGIPPEKVADYILEHVQS